MVIKELFAKLGLDLDEKSFTVGGLLIEGTRKGLVALGTAALAGGAALGALVSNVSETADQIDELSASTGLTTDALQELGYAGSFSGLDMATLGNSMGILARRMKAAKDGSEEAAKSFRAFGGATSGGQLRSIDDMLGAIADRFANMKDGPEKTALAMELFGRSGKQLIPFLNEGSAGLAKLRAEAHALGVVLDEKTIKAGVALDDSLTRVKWALKGVGYELAGALFDDVKAISERFLAWVKANRELIRQRIDLVVTVITKSLKAAWFVVDKLSTAIEFVVKKWRLFAAILAGAAGAAIIANMAAIKAAIYLYRALAFDAVAAGLATAWAWIVAAAPLVALAAGIALVVGIVWDLYNAATGAESVIKVLWDIFTNFMEDFVRDEADDPWWLTAIKALADTIMNLGDAWSDAIDDWKRMINNFSDWAVDKLDFGGKFGKWLAEKTGADGMDGLQDVGRGVQFGGGASPVASATSAQAARGTSSSGNTLAPQIGINISGAGDPKAVGDEVERRFGEVWGRALRDFAAVTQ